MKRRHDDNAKIIETFLKKHIQINILQSIYLGQSQFKTLKILYWIDCSKKTGKVESTKMIEEVHTEKDLQRYFQKEVHDIRGKYAYQTREVVAFACIQGTLQYITIEKMIELSKSDLKFLNSMHFLQPSTQIPMRDHSYYTFAYQDIAGEISHFLIKRTIVFENPTAQHDQSGNQTSNSFYIKSIDIHDPSLRYKAQIFAQTIIKIMLHEKIKIERMNVDFFIDHQSKLWLISLNKCLCTEYYQKDDTYYTQFIFENNFIDRNAELNNFLKNLAKVEKQKKNQKTMERKLLILKQQQSQVSLVRKATMRFKETSRDNSLIKSRPQSNIIFEEDQQPKLDDQKNNEMINIDEDKSEEFQTLSRQSQKEDETANFSAFKHSQTTRSLGITPIRNFKQLNLNHIRQCLPQMQQVQQQIELQPQISQSSLLQTTSFNRLRSKSRKIKFRPNEMVLAQLNFNFNSAAEFNTSRMTKKSSKLFRISSQSRLKRVNNQNFTSSRKQSIDAHSAKTPDFMISKGSYGILRQESPLPLKEHRKGAQAVEEFHKENINVEMFEQDEKINNHNDEDEQYDAIQEEIVRHQESLAVVEQCNKRSPSINEAKSFANVSGLNDSSCNPQQLQAYQMKHQDNNTFKNKFSD